MNLPRTIPLFPLTGVLLLPRGTLPLQAFEPRYLNMVEDALGLGRYIGIIQPAEPVTDPVPGDAVLTPIGCVGKIVGFEETDQGRFRLRILGLTRFRLQETQDHPRGYRLARVSYDGFDVDVVDNPGDIEDRPQLEGAIRDYCDARGVQADWSTVEEASDEALVTSFSMLCPFDPQEKQALLECPDVAARGRLLTSLLTLSAHVPGPADGVRH